MYYMVMYKLAKQGHPWAQKEYDLMLKRMQKWVAGRVWAGRRWLGAPEEWRAMRTEAGQWATDGTSWSHPGSEK
jgi:hypothetical protein